MRKKAAPCLLLLMLLFDGLTASAILSVSAQKEMTPIWTYDDGGDFWRIAISADGKYVAAGTLSTHRLYLFQGNISLWNTLIGLVEDIKMSSNGKYIFAEGDGYIYLFDRESSSPLAKYPSASFDISDEGKYLVTSSGDKVEIFEPVQSAPIWTFEGVGMLDRPGRTVSASSNGDYFVVGGNLPTAEAGAAGNYKIYVFTRGQAQPLWSYDFGVWNGQGVAISGDGNYIIAAAGNKGDGSDSELFQFSTQSSTPLWVTTIGFPTAGELLRVSQNGSIIAVTPVNANPLLVFDKNVKHSSDFTLQGASEAMSSHGKYISIGTFSGVFIVEYSDGSLVIRNRFSENNPLIQDVESSSDGRYVAAVGYWEKGGAHNAVYFFDILHEQVVVFNPLQQWGFLIAVAVIGVSVIVIAFFVHRKRTLSQTHEIAQK